MEALVGRNQNLNLTDNNGQNLSLATFVGELIESPCHKEYSTVPVVVHGFKTTGPKNNSKDTICDLQKARIDIIKIDKIDNIMAAFCLFISTCSLPKFILLLQPDDTAAIYYDHQEARIDIIIIYIIAQCGSFLSLHSHFELVINNGDWGSTSL